MDTLSQLIAEAAELMILGMGFVFLFLGLLVVCMNGLRRLLERFPEPNMVPSHIPRHEPQPGVEPHLIAVIATAVHAHRHKQGQNQQR